MQKFILNNLVEKTLAIVVVYDQELFDCNTLTSLSADLRKNHEDLDVFVYDNSPASHGVPELKGINVIKYIHDSSNPGVSHAYNTGVDYAVKLKKEWVLLLDQDTTFADGIIDAYKDSVAENSEIKLFCPIIKVKGSRIFSPFGKIFKRGYTLKDVKPETYPLQNYSPVNSGILVNVESFTSAGGYNDKVQLDFSDLEFIERFSKKNRLFKVINGFAEQDFSNDTIDVNALNKRFLFFCNGAKNCTKNSFFEKFEYFVVVLLRASILAFRTKRLVFYRTFYKEYLK